MDKGGILVGLSDFGKIVSKRLGEPEIVKQHTFSSQNHKIDHDLIEIKVKMNKNFPEIADITLNFI